VTTAGVAAVSLALDLWSKAWAWERLREGPRITVIERWFYFEFGFNTGAAFSLFRDLSWNRGLFITISVLALAYLVRLAMSLPTTWASGFVAIGCIMAGAAGNLHDRFVRSLFIDGEVRHGVVDFIKVYYWSGKPWPTFNVADISLVVGVGLLLIFLSRHGEALEAAEAARKMPARDAEPSRG